MGTCRGEDEWACREPRKGPGRAVLASRAEDLDMSSFLAGAAHGLQISNLIGAGTGVADSKAHKGQWHNRVRRCSSVLGKHRERSGLCREQVPGFSQWLILMHRDSALQGPSFHVKLVYLKY